jgi:hypothetical protein
MATECWLALPERSDAVITGVTEIAHICTKQDMSRWVRSHADVPGIKWSVFPGPGGTMIIVEYAEDRRSVDRANPSTEVAVPAASSVEIEDLLHASA